MIGKLKGKHDSICQITMISRDTTWDTIRVVFNRDVAYEINTKTYEVYDMEGLSDINPDDLALMRLVISKEIH